jgi:hypothetical protein
VQYNAQLFAILAERLLLENGVDVVYGCYVTDVDVSDGRISALHTASKSGRDTYVARTVVDATGDCDIAHFAGAPTQTFKQGNVLAAWYYLSDSKGYHLRMLGAADVPNEERKGNEEKPLVDRRFGGLDCRELSEMTCLSHSTVLHDWLKAKDKDERANIATLATTPQIRMTRKLVGEYELSHTEQHTYFEDSVGMVSNWKQRGPVYEVPLRTLYCKEVKNLLVAGRCTSVNETLWDVMRVIPCCAVTGQAAGIAAAISDDIPALDVSVLQERLRARGVVLHESELK